MTLHSTRRRRAARDFAVVGAVVSAVMLVATLAANPNASAAATNGGLLQVLTTNDAPLTSGGSATVFKLRPPSAAACTGDSATGGYRIQSYIVPSSVDPASLTWDAGGPTPAGVGAALRQPLFAQGNPFVDGNTAIGTGAIVNVPSFDFAVFGADGPTVVPAGTYNVGLACTKGAASATQLDKYWNAVFTFAVTPADIPSGITWSVPSGVVTTTTTTTTTVAGATTTTVAGATTTTVRGATTTTSSVVGGSSTTTTVFGAGAVTTTRYAGVTTLPGNIVNTGSSPLPIVLWGLLLLVFGRMAILLGRPIRVRSHESP